MKDIGERIRAARLAARLKLTTVAYGSGVSTQSVHGWETGKTSPLASRVPRLASTLGVNVEWLMTGKGRRKP